MNPMLSMLMGRLRNQNPQAFNELQGLMNSGKNPNQILNEMLSSGRFTPEQIQQAQNMANQYSSGNNPTKRF